MLFISCKQDPSTLRVYQIPENIEDGLEVGTLEEVDIDQGLIEKGVYDIDNGKYGEVHSILIYKDGKLVLDEYFTGHKYQWDAPNAHGDLVTFTKSTQHLAHSVTKSITSACIGIAIDKGFIQIVNQSIFDYLPEHEHLNTDGKDIITIEHLLTMTSGLEFNEWGTLPNSPDNDVARLWFYCEDPITCILERPLINEPGTSFNYSSGNMDILGEIIKNASGMDLDEFSGKYLFEPLGIGNFIWAQFENGVIDAAGGVKFTPRDMVKTGVTFLNNGVWNGKQIISKQWVEKSATAFQGNTGIKIPGEDLGKVGYAYTWWTREYSISDKRINGFWADGWGGQKIMVFPEIDTVIVFSGGNYTSNNHHLKILEKYIFPAIN